MLSNRYNKKRLSLGPNNTYDDAYFMSAPDLIFNRSEEKHPDSEESKSGSKDDVPNEDAHAWLILVAVVCFYTVTGYSSIAFGLYYVTFSETFGTTKAVTGFIPSIAGATTSSFSIFASVFIDLYGVRPVGVVGCLLASFGIFSSAFATNIYMLYLTYGFILGLGSSMSHLCALIIVQQHFNKHRKLATSISMIGIPVGCIISPFITNILLNSFGWRGTLALQSGIYLHTLALVMTFSPPRNKDPNNQENNSVTFIKSLCDCSIMKNVVFFPFLIGTIAMRLNLVSFIDHTPSRAVFFGADLKSAGYLTTVMFFTALISRIFCSVISGCGLLKPLAGTVGVVLAEAICSLSLPFCSSYYAVMFVTGIFGLAQGFMAPCVLLATVKLFGVSKFGRARAVINLLASVGNFSATPLTGLLFDITQNYNIPFYFSGLMGLVSTLSMVLLIVIYNIREHRNNNSPQSDKQDDEFDIEEVKRLRTITF